MEKITRRSCDYDKDQQRLMDFWLDCRAASDVRAYPTIWRIRLLLTSRVWNPEKDAQIWENESGQIMGFAMSWSRQPASAYVVLDTLLHPQFAGQGLLSRILNWGNFRVTEIAKEQETALTVYVNGFSRYDFSAGLMKRHGFALVPLDSDEYNVYFARSLQNRISLAVVLPGYKIRSLQSTDDVEAYEALYGFAKVHPLHRQELIESDEYCHLVAVNPDGEFVAYCECSVCYTEWQRTGQRIGWIDYVATRPEQQKKGLGQAILTAGLLQLQERGAETAILVTINTNIPAVNLYNKVGFRIVEIKEYPSYEKQVRSPKESHQRK